MAIIIFICVLASMNSQILMSANTPVSRSSLENFPFRQVEKEALVTKAETSSGLVLDVKTWVWGKVNAIIESLKNPSGPSVNPRNRCMWKICSKPLRSLRINETISLKDMKNKLPLSTNLG